MFGYVKKKEVYSKIDELIDILDERLLRVLDIRTVTEKEKADRLEAIHKLDGSIKYLRLLRSKI